MVVPDPLMRDTMSPWSILDTSRPFTASSSSYMYSCSQSSAGLPGMRRPMYAHTHIRYGCILFIPVYAHIPTQHTHTHTHTHSHTLHTCTTHTHTHTHTQHTYIIHTHTHNALSHTDSHITQPGRSVLDCSTKPKLVWRLGRSMTTSLMP